MPKVFCASTGMTVLTMLLAACGGDSSDTESTQVQTRPGVTGAFIASCGNGGDPTGATNQCIEWYGDSPPSDFVAVFDESCGDYRHQCPIEGSLGGCAFGGDSLPPGLSGSPGIEQLDFVQINYPCEGCLSAEQWADFCESWGDGGVYVPPDGTGPSGNGGTGGSGPSGDVVCSEQFCGNARGQFCNTADGSRCYYVLPGGDILECGACLNVGDCALEFIDRCF